jgi:ribosome-binding factor A
MCKLINRQFAGSPMYFFSSAHLHIFAFAHRFRSSDTKHYICLMDSLRQQKYGRLIQKEISELFQREGYNFFGKAFVTVTGAQISPDLGIAKIYVSIFGNQSQSVLNQIEKHNKEIRKQLGARIRHQARIIPELKFFLDDSLDQVEKIEKLLKDSRPPQDDESIS